jgi:hypothetical protein
VRGRLSIPETPPHPDLLPASWEKVNQRDARHANLHRSRDALFCARGMPMTRALGAFAKPREAERRQTQHLKNLRPSGRVSGPGRGSFRCGTASVRDTHTVVRRSRLATPCRLLPRPPGNPADDAGSARRRIRREGSLPDPRRPVLTDRRLTCRHTALAPSCENPHCTGPLRRPTSPVDVPRRARFWEYRTFFRGEDKFCSAGTATWGADLRLNPS